MSKVYLKIKIKSLAAEASMIRREEHLWKLRDRELFFGLRSHRTWDVRREARAALLAYGFLRGRPYKKIEAFTYDPPPFGRVVALVKKYGAGSEIVMDWFQGRTEMAKAA